ncbi:hypothetical protein C8R44DRAFT_744644 [Mycena epipterygia]|nr:hypothetical protein C8R44DRAFT_744644 [Mycena epipterygia]
MLQGGISLSILSPTALAEAVGNPPDIFRSWSCLHPARLSSFFVQDWCLSDQDDPLPEIGETSFVVDGTYQVFGSDAAVTICYKHNTNVLECAENIALDGTQRGIDSSTIELILSHVQTKPGLRTFIEFRTLPDGSFHVEYHLRPLQPDAKALPNPNPLPSAPLSSLQCTHELTLAPSIFLVKIMSDHPSDNDWFFKTSASQSALINEVEFMTSLPEIDFLLRPTHIVPDEGGLF